MLQIIHSILNGMGWRNILLNAMFGVIDKSLMDYKISCCCTMFAFNTEINLVRIPSSLSLQTQKKSSKLSAMQDADEGSSGSQCDARRPCRDVRGSRQPHGPPQAFGDAPASTQRRGKRTSGESLMRLSKADGEISIFKG
jgi:hypothetical protein